MHRALSILFQERHVTKRYIAIVAGIPAEERGQGDLPLLVDWPRRPLHKVDLALGKPALTRYEILVSDLDNNTARLALIPETGRTHQLRVHMQALGHPILGDPLYAEGIALASADRLLLHAQQLAFVHPITGKPMSFTRQEPF